MYTQTTMAKDLTFKLRLDAKDRERLEAVAAHLSVPAATAIRMAIKEKYDRLPMAVPEYIELVDGTIERVQAGEITKDEKANVTVSLHGQTYRLVKGRRPEEPHTWVHAPGKGAGKGGRRLVVRKGSK